MDILLIVGCLYILASHIIYLMFGPFWAILFFAMGASYLYSKDNDNEEEEHKKVKWEKSRRPPEGQEADAP